MVRILCSEYTKVFVLVERLIELGDIYLATVIKHGVQSLKYRLRRQVHLIE